MTRKANGGDSGGWEPGEKGRGNEHFKTINGRRIRLYQSGDGDTFHYEVEGEPGGTVPAETMEEAAEHLDEHYGKKPQTRGK